MGKLLQKVQEFIIQSKSPREKIIIIGNSLGGLTILEYCARYPEKIPGSIILTCPALKFYENEYLKKPIKEWKEKGFHIFESLYLKDIPIKYDFYDSLLNLEIDNPTKNDIKLP